MKITLNEIKKLIRAVLLESGGERRDFYKEFEKVPRGSVKGEVYHAIVGIKREFKPTRYFDKSGTEKFGRVESIQENTPMVSYIWWGTGWIPKELYERTLTGDQDAVREIKQYLNDVEQGLKTYDQYIEDARQAGRGYKKFGEEESKTSRRQAKPRADDRSPSTRQRRFRNTKSSYRVDADKMDLSMISKIAGQSQVPFIPEAQVDTDVPQDESLELLKQSMNLRGGSPRDFRDYKRMWKRLANEVVKDEYVEGSKISNDTFIKYFDDGLMINTSRGLKKITSKGQAATLANISTSRGYEQFRQKFKRFVRLIASYENLELK
jgi:hypothetical protein